MFVHPVSKQNLNKAYLDSVRLLREDAQVELSDDDVYRKLTSDVAPPGKDTPAPSSVLLSKANWNHNVKWLPNGARTTTLLPLLKACVLKDQVVWEAIRKVMEAYQTAELPHPHLNEAAAQIATALGNAAKKGRPLLQVVGKIFKEHRSDAPSNLEPPPPL